MIDKQIYFECLNAYRRGFESALKITRDYGFDYDKSLKIIDDSIADEKARIEAKYG
jgi:hypothetical protein